jgi:hypothetical protein
VKDEAEMSLQLFTFSILCAENSISDVSDSEWMFCTGFALAEKKKRFAGYGKK